MVKLLRADKLHWANQRVDSNYPGTAVLSVKLSTCYYTKQKYSNLRCVASFSWKTGEKNISKTSPLANKNSAYFSLQILNGDIGKTKKHHFFSLLHLTTKGKMLQDGKSFFSTSDFLKLGKISQLWDHQK